MIEGLIIAGGFIFFAGFAAGAGYYYWLAHRTSQADGRRGYEQSWQGWR